MENVGINNHLSPVQQSASAFVLAEARQLDSFLTENAVVDVKGATEAVQSGHLFNVARTVLEKGIDAYLESVGYADITAANRFRMLETATGKGSELLLQAQALEMANPMSFAEVVIHAESCINYVDLALNVRPPKFLKGYDDAALLNVYNQRTKAVDALADHLGMPSPFPMTRLPRYIKGVTDPNTSMRDQGGTTR